jgi:hypothetical protein
MQTLTYPWRTGRRENGTPEPAEAFTPLVGPWLVHGAVYESLYGPAAPWRSHEQCEWLWGKRFVLHHWRARIGEHPFDGVTVLGHSAAQGYFASLYDNAGNTLNYRVEIHGRDWTVSGARQRGSLRFAPDSDAIDIHWDWRRPDGTWAPLSDRRAVRMGATG